MFDEIENGTAEQPADLRSVLTQAMESQRAAEDTPQQADTNAGDGAGGAEDEGAGADADAAGRVRDRSGRFQRKEAAEAGVAGAADGDVAAPRADEQAADQQAVTGAAEAPTNWSAEDKQKFGSLPAEARGPFLEMYKRMEGGFTPKLQKLAAIEKDFAGIPEMFAPHTEALRAQNRAPADIIKIWAATEQALIASRAAAASGRPDKNGAAMVARIISGYQIDPSDVAEALHEMAGAGGGRQTNGTGQPPVTRTEVPPEVEARLRRIEAAEHERVTSQRQSATNAAQNQIDTFANEKAADGSLKHPFLADVEKDMIALAQIDLSTGKTPNLPDLYDRAVYANPATRRQLLTLEKEREAKQAAAARKAKAEAAQRASSSVTGSPAAGQSPNESRRTGTGSVRDALRAAIEEHSEVA